MNPIGRFFRRLFGPPPPPPPRPHGPAEAGPQDAPAAPAPPPVPTAGDDPYFVGTDPSSKAKADEKLGLNAGAYLPVSREELLQEARGLPRGNDPWSGRRDLIPPADDTRTNLIDRALVTGGYLTAEELREAHEVGDLMDQVRPRINAVEAKAARTGADAVQADREAWARLKAQKKAEAVERRRRRAEEVAERQATDILFLGRGVSARLGDRVGDPSRLAQAALPILSTPADLADAMGLTIPRLRWLAFHAEVATRVHYVQFEVPKRSGGTRNLSAPHRGLARAQQWVFREIVSGLPADDAAHGFVPGRGIVSNAAPHCRRAVVLNMDLEGFFPSIQFPRVRHVFQRLGYSPAVATVLALLCTECPRRPVVYDGATYHVATGPRGLPQGACTSPGLSNQVVRRLDRRLSGLARRFGLNYTRYADDLTFSGDEAMRERLGYLMARVRHIAADEGFSVNEAKTRVLKQGTAQTVTGLVVNDRPGVPRAEVRRLRAILHRARTEGLARQNRENHSDFVAWLRGKIAFVTMVRPEAGAVLKRELEAVLARGG